jgi:glycosyltransferase involved in cell wall biosynthesis
MTGADGVSAIIAVKDGERHLGEAIESVVSQSHPPLEVIVVDGDSKDRSAEIARSFDLVRLIEQDGLGLSGAWNQGLEASSGGLIAFLDSDDVWLPGKLEAQVELLGRRPELAGCLGLSKFVVEPGSAPPPGFRTNLLQGEHPGPMPGTLLVRREVFDRIGDFDPEYAICMDVDWFARVKDAGLELATIPRLFLEKRFHSRNLSHSQPERYRSEMLRAIRDSAARQAAHSGR